MRNVSAFSIRLSWKATAARVVKFTAEAPTLAAAEAAAAAARTPGAGQRVARAARAAVLLLKMLMYTSSALQKFDVI